MVGFDSIRGAHQVQPAWEGEAHHAPPVEEEHGRDDGGGPPHLPLRGHRLHVIPRLFDERRAQGAVDRRAPLHPPPPPRPPGVGTTPPPLPPAGRAGGGTPPPAPRRR